MEAYIIKVYVQLFKLIDVNYAVYDILNQYYINKDIRYCHRRLDLKQIQGTGQCISLQDRETYNLIFTINFAKAIPHNYLKI